MNKYNLKIYSIEILLLLILSFALFVPTTLGRIALSIVLVMYCLFTIKFLKKKNIASTRTKQVTILMTVFAIIYLVSFYLLGLYFKYYSSLIKFSLWSVLNYIIPISFIIITTEIMRNLFLAQENKYGLVINFISMVLIDLIIYRNMYNYDSLEGILNLVGFVTFASIANNLLFNYISKRYGFLPNIIYRLLTVLYVYIIPIIPNVLIFFRSILRIIYPYIIYQILEYTYSNKNFAIAYVDKRKSFIGKAIFFLSIILVAMLISCKFIYGVMVIGSGSMTGAINKGDVIVFKAYDNQEIEIGDIIVFKKYDTTIVHRVVDKEIVNSEVRYYTKGDANTEVDEGYIISNEIVGITKFKIQYLGYPTIWIRDLLK